MDSTRRTIAKALSWQLLGLLTMTVVGTFLTGSASTGGALALTSAVIGALCYIAHEKLWALVPWGRLPK